jgi:regulator of protease activity HflC (stomatin/prohibitin superfamily)
MENFSLAILGLLSAYLLFQFVRSIRIIPNQQAFIIERLGKFQKTARAGLQILIPFADKVRYELSLKEETISVDPQECFTKDNVRVEVDGVIYIVVNDPKQAAYGITNYRFAAVQLAQTTIRSAIGTLDLDETFEERSKINSEVLRALNEIQQVWGIEVRRYEVKNIVPPKSVSEALERQMAADRERRAVLARAEGKKQAMINESEGIKQQMINQSEGEKSKIINESEGHLASVINKAEGHSEKIILVSEATAVKISRIALASQSKGAADVMKLDLFNSFTKSLADNSKQDNKTVMAMDLTSIKEMMQNILL